MADYTLAPSFQLARIDQYVALFGASYAGDAKLSASYLEWQYVSNPHGQVIGFDAFKGEELAAHYAIIPRRYRCGARVFQAALSVNTATHPDHQGKGLFTKLANATYQAAVDRGVSFVVGVANANSVGGFVRKLRFTALGHVRLYAGVCAPRNAADLLELEGDSDWLAWRLSNPSRMYNHISHHDGTSTLRTYVRGIPFNIGRVHSSNLTASMNRGLAAKGCRLLPGLTPLFTPMAPSVLRLPLRVQPSPWHVIWRTLDSDLDASLALQLRFDGLSMDTF
jgi:GNAT superfamily N-acetyltransferase